MNSAWMFSSVLVSLLIFTAALCVERMLMLRRGTPVRWVWMVAIAVSVAWSARWLLPASAIVETPQDVSSISSEVSGIVVIPSAASEPAPFVRESALSIDWTPGWTTKLALVSAPPLSEQAESLVRLLWLCTSMALLVALLWSHVRLAREREQWRETSLLGSDVLVSDGFGPAIVGMRRPSIVVPPWVLSVDTSAQRAILLHEGEHRRAGDQWLLLASFGTVVLAPWNVFIWLMRRRLARGVELDCDQRVLTHGVVDVDYANVLLSAWQRSRGVAPWVPSPALTEHVSRLGRRVEHLMRPVPRRRVMKTIGGTFASAFLMGAAAFVPAPQQAQSAPPTPSPAQVSSIPAPSRELVPALPPTPAPSPSIPAERRVPASPAATPTPSRVPSLPSQAPNPPVPAIGQPRVPPVPTPTTPTPPTIPQKRARLLVVMPWDSAAAPLAKAVHERLAEDLRDKMVYVIPHNEFMQYAIASGFSSNTLFTPSDLKAFRNLLRADLVVAVFRVRHVDGGIRVFASTVGAGEAAPLPSLEGDGSDGISLSLIRALHADTAYRRLRQPQSDPVSAAPARAAFAPAFSFKFRLRPDSNSRMAPVIIDSTRRTFSFRFLSGANTWKVGFFADTTRRLTAFRFRPATTQWFTRFGSDTTGRVVRFSRPPLG